MYNAYLFFIKYFKGPIIVPYFTHNAIPSNVKDLKEIYDLVYNSKYKNGTLDSLERHTESLQFQTSVNIYTFNKYNRKVNLIKYNYIDNENAIKGDFNYPLFCIIPGIIKIIRKFRSLKRDWSWINYSLSLHHMKLLIILSFLN